MEVYVHGNPRGQQTWGAKTHTDYIASFYNRDYKPTDKTQLQIDIIDGVSFYTYKRFNIVDTEGRPDSYFAITVVLGGQYCSDVYSLFKLFEAVYNKLGALLIKTTNRGEQYSVTDFTQANHDGKLAVELIQEIIIKNIEEKLGSKLLPLSAITTVNKPKKEFNLQEVDSPLFVEYMKIYSIIVSPGDRTAIKRLEVANKHLSELTVRNREIDLYNSQLKDKVDTLTQQNASLTSQLSQTTSSTEKRYKSKLDQLTKERDLLKKERDEAKAKLNSVSSAVNQLDIPVKELTRLMAGRFPEDTNHRRISTRENDYQEQPIRPTTIRTKRINSILLCCVLAINIIILAFLLITKTEYNTPIEEIQSILTQSTITKANESSKMSSEFEEISQNDTISSTDETINPIGQNFEDFKNCKIDIIGGSNNLKLNTIYTLRVLKKDNTNANVPNGTWEVKAKGVLLNGNGIQTFSIKDSSLIGEKVEISYIVKDKPVVIRNTCTIVK